MNGSRSSSLATRGLHALKWNYLGTPVRNVSQLLIGVVLARLLGPEPFGIIAVQWLILGVGNLISDLGFATASALLPSPDL